MKFIANRFQFLCQPDTIFLNSCNTSSTNVTKYYFRYVGLWSLSLSFQNEYWYSGLPKNAVLQMRQIRMVTQGLIWESREEKWAINSWNYELHKELKRKYLLMLSLMTRVQQNVISLSSFQFNWQSIESICGILLGHE